MSSKVFGIISYFPDKDTDYHKSVRRQREKRFAELLMQLNSYWTDIDIMVIAQNWQGFTIPIIHNSIQIYEYPRQGILGARRFLRQKFLDSDYDYLIMLDDDAVLKTTAPKEYINEIDNHPDGFGVIRHFDHPLNLCAISKSIYSKIDLPNIDTENEEGFGDAVFVAQCFARFPENSFDFTEAVQDISIKLSGLKSCPSTWQGETVVDKRFMGNITEALIQASEHEAQKATDTFDTKVDIIIPYVDSSDPEWQRSYNSYIQKEAIKNRYQSWDTLRYLLRGIEQHISFVRDVILVVACESQVPNWINKDEVRIVYHRDFIPERFLPTFNSCTIESFLYNISDITEQFLYFNDDIFPINDVEVSDFFLGGKPHLKFQEHQIFLRTEIFHYQCRKGLDTIAKRLHQEQYPQNELLIPEHSVFPMLKSSIDKVGKLCKEDLEDTISRLREPKKIKQYIYHYYQYFTGNYIKDFCPYMYMELDDNIDRLSRIVSIDSIKFVCLNDMNIAKDYESIRDKLIAIFENKFPKLSKYEEGEKYD